MVNELKVYNRFGELTLHLRHSLGVARELIIVDATEDMRAAVAGFKGSDFDRTIAKGSELIRLTADWGSPQYLSVLAQYLGMNFGWKTQTIEVEEPISLPRESVYGSGVPLVTSPQNNVGGNFAIVFANVSVHRPESSPLVEFRLT